MRDTDDGCVIFSDQAVWVHENYRARIEEKLGGKAVITSEITDEPGHSEDG